jgi:hypothetical protein
MPVAAVVGSAMAPRGNFVATTFELDAKFSDQPGTIR